MMRRAAIATLAPLLLSCRAPWTVRRIADADAAGAPGEGGRFDAAGYVESIWEARVVPAARQAIGFDEWRRGPAAARLVKGSGKVLGAESGRLLVDIPPYDGRADLALDTGSAIRGTALRDALPFIQFSQFVNQVDFAKVASALDARAAKAVEAALGGRTALGATVSFAGAAAVPVGANPPEVIPVILDFQTGAGRPIA
jgi:predicted lipoprotein